MAHFSGKLTQPRYRRSASRRPACTGMTSTRVLIVDDQPIFRQAARDLLEARGYSVVAEAECLASALEALGRAVPDAVLLDVRRGRRAGSTSHAC